MLQQTQVARVIPVYSAFIKTFPTIRSLAAAPLRTVLAAWQGLGYNRRALMLRRAAQLVCERHNGKLPGTEAELVTLPGIGPATAAAIAAFAYNRPTVYLETNVRSVFLHHFCAQRKNVRDKDIVPLIEQTLDKKNPRQWYAALLDYGAALKRAHANPSRRSAHYAKQSPFAGSDREIRGNVIKRLIAHKKQTIAGLARSLAADPERVRRAVAAMKTEGLVKQHAQRICLA